MDDLVARFLASGESKVLDFKAPTSWNPNGDKAGCCGLVKDILAMANTNGGHLLIGVEEPATGPLPVGLNSQQLATWDTTKVNQFLARYAEPTVNMTLVKQELNGKHFVVIVIPPFPATLHLCKIDYPGVLRKPAIYVRTDNNESAEVSTTVDLNHLVERSIRNRSDQLLTQFRSLLVGASIQDSPSAEEHFQRQFQEAVSRFEEFFPEGADPRIGFLQFASWPARFEESRFTLPSLREAAAVANADVDRSNWISPLWPGIQQIPIAIQDGIESWVNLSEEHWFQFWRLQRSGFLFHRQTIVDDVDLGGQFGPHEPGQILALERCIAVIGMAVAIVRSVYGALGIADEEVSLRFEVINAQGRRLRAPATWTIWDESLISHIDHIHAQCTASIEEWTANAEGLATGLVSELMQRFNSTHPRFPPRVLQEVLAPVE